MALVTTTPVSLITKTQIVQDDAEKEETGEIGEIIALPSPAKKRLLRQGSVSENFFAVKGASLILPRKSTPDNKHMEVMQGNLFGGDLKTHLYAICNIIRPQDSIKLVARLESWVDTRMRYIVIATAIGRQDTEESILLGMDFPVNDNTTCTIGLVIPIWSDTVIQLDGDGGFQITGRERKHTFKPVSVQAMWSALQAVHKCVSIAQQHNYYYGSLYLTWICYYESRVNSPRLFLNEWEFIENIWSRRPNYFEELDPEREKTELKIRNKLKEVMVKMDLDNCTSRDIREALEKVIDLDLKEYKTYIDTEMLTVLGQMDTASKILDFLYLGSEWNASNLEELTEIGITHILNITMEIDNFYPEDFTYKNIRCYDEESTILLPYWNDTWNFIKEAQKSNGKCLVHCKMGISRSAASVSAFLMKENLWSMEKAISYTRQRRSIIRPNKAFMRQLQEYEGIIFASAQRHNMLFRSRSESNLTEEHGNHTKESNEEQSVTTITEQQHQPTFDLNRRLLDLAVLPYRSVRERPKSWSPGESKHSYIDEITSSERSEVNSFMNRSHMSEPMEISDKVEKQIINKRKKWRRRHTERIIPIHDIEFESLAQSEDSVFVNPGGVPIPRIDTWMTEKSEPKMKKNVSSRLSSPAALETPKDKLAVDSPVHSSFISPMNSPSFKCTKNVSVSDLKSYFREEEHPVLQVDISASTAVISQTDQSEELLPTVSQDAQEDTSPAVNLENDDENNFELAKGIDEDVVQSSLRERSMSETQVFYVKNMVSEIESRYTAEPGAKDENESTESESRTVGISRSQSLTTSHSKSTDLSLSLIINNGQTMDDSNMITAKNNNSNENNNNNNNVASQNLYPNTTVIEIDHDSNNKPQFVKTMLQPGCCIKENISQSDITIALSSPTKTETEFKRNVFVRMLTQSELHVIREVGKTFLSESDDTDSVLLSECSSPSSTSTNMKEDEKESTSYKKRGVVRRMAKMIEHKIKRHSKKDPHGRHKVTGQQFEQQPTNSNIVMNKLLMGESTFTSIKTNTSENDNITQEPIANLDHKSARDPSQGNLNDLLSLVGPTPYSPAHTSLANVTSNSLSKPLIKYRKGTMPIRRTQSERTFVRPIKTFFHSFREKHTSHSELTTDIAMDESPEQCSPVAVKQIVKYIENLGIGDRGADGSQIRQPEKASSKKQMKVLSRYNSNPHIAQKAQVKNVSSSSLWRCNRQDNHATQFYRNSNLYNTM